MTQFSRRTFAGGALGSLLTFSLLETLFETDAFAEDVQPITAKWLKELHDLGLDVRGGKLTQLQWQSQTEALFRQVNLPELLRFIDFKKLTQNLVFRKQGEKSLRPKFPEVIGLPTELVFGRQVFALKKDRSVAPHGHDNMATAFLVLQGDFHGRHYDRLEDNEDHYIIKPTIDEKFTVGGCSSISDHKDNVHWFKTTSETGFIFNIHVLNVVEGKSTGRVYVDPNGEKLAGGKIRPGRSATPKPTSSTDKPQVPTGRPQISPGCSGATLGARQSRVNAHDAAGRRTCQHTPRCVRRATIPARARYSRWFAARWDRRPGSLLASERSSCAIAWDPLEGHSHRSGRSSAGRRFHP